MMHIEESFRRLDFGIKLLLGAVLVLLVVASQRWLGNYPQRVAMLCCVYVVMAIGLNIIFGFTGMFSLGHYGFMMIGAYVAVILSLPAEQKKTIYYVKGIEPWLADIQIDFLSGILIGGFAAAAVAVIIGFPILKSLNDDYLGIATLGFAEIVRIVINNLITITNGPLGIKGLPRFINLYWCAGFAAFSVLFAVRLNNISLGKVFNAIRDNEIAAEACGINLIGNKVLSFAIGSFFAGIGGALMGYWTATIDPKMFSQNQNFMVLMIIVTGGLGNITGTVIMSFVITIGMEWLRFVEERFSVFGYEYQGIPGTRMLVFSLLLLVIILKFQRGIFGGSEFSAKIFYTRPKIFDSFRKRKGER